MHTARLLRPLAVAASVAALAMFAALPAGATAASSPHSSKIVQVHPMILTPGASTSGSTVVSGNWAGYAALPRHSGGKFRYIAATFTVPSVNCSATPDSFSVHWVGLDGAGGTNPTVEQDGIESSCNGSTPAYSAWWETFPGNSIQPVASINLSPGDAVIASVFYNTASGSHHNMFNLILNDVTNGNSFNLWENCGALSGHTCKRNSAEVISEAPSSGSILPLADYGIESFVNVKITDKGKQKGGISSSNWKHDKIIQASNTDTLATPSRLYGSHAFSNTWKNES
jgi:Peptidase A4 family